MHKDMNFFEKPSEQSIVKSEIVSKYFKVWAKIMITVQQRNTNNFKIGYFDLFSGPGQYEDGTPSTPLLVLDIAQKDNDISQRLVTIFNDKNKENISSLQKIIEKKPEINKLVHKPILTNFEIGKDIQEQLFDKHTFPTLFFIDPWGYKGITLSLIGSLLKNWGCDGIVFFNYNRINPGLKNAKVKEHMNALFGEERVNSLNEKLDILKSVNRETLIIEELCQAIKALKLPYVLPFCFKDKKGTRTSHHLIFISKNILGYEIMKEIMAEESSKSEQNVPFFEYNPVDKQDNQQLLFQLSRPLDDLGDMLLDVFAGQTLTMKEIYERHNVDRPYIKKNYKQVLLKLEIEKKIFTSHHRRDTFGDDVSVEFPRK